MSNLQRWIGGVGVGLVLLGAGSAFAADWPQWRGPQRNGISAETGLLKEWPQGGPKLLWQVTDLGSGYSTPAVVGDRLYVLSNQGVENEAVRALDLKDGKPVWSTRVGKVGNPDQQPAYPAARSTPTIATTISTTSPSPITARCSIRPRSTWRRAASACWRNWARALTVCG